MNIVQNINTKFCNFQNWNGLLTHTQSRPHISLTVETLFLSYTLSDPFQTPIYSGCFEFTKDLKQLNSVVCEWECVCFVPCGCQSEACVSVWSYLCSYTCVWVWYRYQVSYRTTECVVRVCLCVRLSALVIPFILAILEQQCESDSVIQW